MLKINQIDLRKQYNSTEEELKAAKSYIYQLVEELRYRLADKEEEEPEEEQTAEEVVGEAVRASSNYIQAEGIDAGWIRTGILRDNGGSFYFNLDNGTLRTNALKLQLSDHGNQTLEEYLNAMRNDIENQIDGEITSWFYDYTPTNENYPAAEWINDGKAADHLGDTFYNLDTGYSYKWLPDSEVEAGYSWRRITDSDVTAALAKASQALDVADGKRTIYTTTTMPTPPYDEGDLWANGEDLYRCINTRKDAAPYTFPEDWADATSYGTNISNLYTQLDIQQGQIDLKVANSDYNGQEIASRINVSPEAVKIKSQHLEYNAEQIVNGINSSTNLVIGAGHLDLSNKADISVVDTVSGLQTELKRQETRITANENEISTKASTTLVNAINGRLTTAESAITQTSNEIALKVSRKDISIGNLIPQLYYDEPLTGTGALTRNGLTFEVLSDGKIKVTGKASSTTYFKVADSLALDLNATYTLSGCPTGGSANTFYMYAGSRYDYGSGVTFSNVSSATIYIAVKQNQTMNHTFAPQLEPGSVKTSYKNPRTGTNRAWSMIRQTADGITSKVSKGDIASTINQTAQSVKIDASKIDLSGYVTISDAKTSGKTTINGGNITTGIIKDSAGNMSLNLGTGAIAAKKLSINSTNFKLTEAGIMTATKGSFSGTVTVGGKDNEWGIINVYDGNGKLENQLDYNGLRMYRTGTFIGRVGTNLYTGNETWIGFDFNSNAKGIEFTETSGNKIVYRFPCEGDGAVPKFYGRRSAINRIEITPDNLTLRDAYSRTRVNLTPNYLQLRDSSDRTRVNLTPDYLQLRDSSDRTRVNLTPDYLRLIDSSSRIRVNLTPDYLRLIDSSSRIRVDLSPDHLILRDANNRERFRLDYNGCAWFDASGKNFKTV